MDKRPMISVIVPIYNACNYLSECVSSIINQTYNEIEIILVDDGSTDGSGMLCDELGKRDGRIKVIHKENGGSTSARNMGLKMSKGEYIGFVDSDDWLEPDMYEELLKACIESSADIAVCQQYINRGDVQYLENRSVGAGVYRRGEGTIAHNIIYSDDFSQRGITQTLYDKLYKRDIILRNQGLVDERTKFAEDDICVYASLLDSNIVAVLDTPYYHVRILENSITRSTDETYFEKITLFYQQMKKVFEMQTESKMLLEKLNRYMLEFVIKGINYSFGFGYGVVVPFYIPPYQKLKDMGASKVILYGAGNVGKAYYYGLKKTKIADIVLWVDTQYDTYVRQGFDVHDVSEIGKIKDYDVVLIAVESSVTMDKIRQSLIDLYYVENGKILIDSPRKIIEDL